MATDNDYPLLIKQLLHTPLANAADQEIIHAEFSRYTYRELAARLARLGTVLSGLGLGHGSTIAVMDWDSHRYFECFFAVPMIGATLHTVNVRLSPEQILFTINHAQDDAILVHQDFVPLLAQIADRITRPTKFILLQDIPAAIPGTLPFVGEYERALAAATTPFTFPDFDERTRATLFYTTGTTGDPKGVSFSHRQLVLHTLGVIATLGPVPNNGGLHRGDVYMPITPLFHVHGWGIPYVATMLGLKQVYPGRYDPKRLLGLIAEHDVTFSHCVPTILNMLLSAPESGQYDLSKWKVLVGGAALSAGLAQAALARGIDVNAGYGMSETCPLLSLSDMTPPPSGEIPLSQRTATGKAAQMVELRVVDADMNDLPRDGVTTGEVVARAPWLTLGYLGNPQGTTELWRGGYLHTGDVGYFDADGTLHITDRIKDVIKSGGEWVSSLQLEDIASAEPAVAEVAAICVPDSKWGERPVLIVALRPNFETTAARRAILGRLQSAIDAGKISKWALPEHIEFVDALPKTSVGKLDKKRMRLDFAHSPNRD